MSFKNWVIKRLGGIPKSQIPEEIQDSITGSGWPEGSIPDRGKVEFISEPGAQEEEDALEEINRPWWKKFLDGFKVEKS